MELGQSVLKGSNVNALSQAIHPRHGLVWSDGKSIYQGSIDISNNIINNNTSTRLGEFNNVCSVCWSNDVENNICFMCVVHHTNVSVWKVSGSTPKLTFKQIRKINVKPITQGVLWNPKCDVLCLLSPSQVSFYFNHLTNKGSYAFLPLISGKVTCGCWSKDGNKLLVCVGSSLLIYTWPDIESSVSDFMPSAWTLPKSDGNVTAIVPINDTKYVCCVDLPLGKLCQKQDIYLIPDNKRGESIKDQLLNLPKNPETIINDSSELIYFQINNDGRSSVRLNTISLQGLLSPDLLVYESSGCVIIGSNSLPTLQVFTVTDTSLVLTSDINLEKNERPKGINCFYGNKILRGVLLLVAQKDKQDDLFPSSSNDTVYNLTLKFFPVKPDTSLQHSVSLSALTQDKTLKSTSTKNKYTSDSAIQKSVTDNYSEDHQPISLTSQINSDQHCKSLVTNIDGTQSSNKDLEIVQTNFKDTRPRFQNEDLKLINNKNGVLKSADNKSAIIKSERESEQPSSNCENVTTCEDTLSDCGLASISNCNSGNYEVLESLVENQKDQIEELQKKVESLSKLVQDSSVVNSTKYQTPEKPEFIMVECLYDSGNTVTKRFLLDNGRLQLDSLKLAFKLDYIELLIDEEPMILGANIDGYIPLKFLTGSHLHIIGNKKSEETITANDDVSLLHKDPQTGATKC